MILSFGLVYVLTPLVCVLFLWAAKSLFREGIHGDPITDGIPRRLQIFICSLMSLIFLVAIFGFIQRAYDYAPPIPKIQVSFSR